MPVDPIVFTTLSNFDGLMSWHGLGMSLPPQYGERFNALFSVSPPTVIQSQPMMKADFMP